MVNGRAAMFRLYDLGESLFDNMWILPDITPVLSD
jgi:hypothetical protein